jgi:RNA polymerase sigma-70 factor (ECF subfamily)
LDFTTRNARASKAHAAQQRTPRTNSIRISLTISIPPFADLQQGKTSPQTHVRCLLPSIDILVHKSSIAHFKLFCNCLQTFFKIFQLFISPVLRFGFAGSIINESFQKCEVLKVSKAREEISPNDGRILTISKDELSLIAEKYWDMVYRIALNYYGNKCDAEDTTQDVMLKFCKSAEKLHFESEEHIRYWLVRVAVNACKSTLRSFWRKNRTSLTEITDSVTWDNTEQSELYSAVMSLPEQHRTVLYLHYYEEFTKKEIAEMLKLSEAHVRTRLSRARNKLKEVWSFEDE